MKKLFKRTRKILPLILGIFFLGCGSDDAEIIIPKVVAGFTSTINADTGTAAFTNTSTNANTYAWDFGDGNTSTEANPTKNFSSGTYTVSLTASNNAGASDTFEDEITVLIPVDPVAELTAAVLPITFDDATVDYAVTAFNGVAFTVVDNPATGGTNTVASKVGSIVNIGAEFEGFFFELGTAIDLTTNKSITMNFWSDAAVAVLVKLEEGDASIEATSNHGGTGWETLTVDFPSTLSYSILTIFANATGTEAGTYYIDDIEQIATVGGLSCTAETEESLSVTDFNLTFQNELTGLIESFDAGLSRVANPDADNAVNTSCFVGKIDRTAAEFANNQIKFDSKFDFSANAGFKMKVWSPTAGTNVLVKLEDQANAGSFVELTAVTTTAGAWEELTFPVAASDSGKFDFIILFFELATFTEETYFIDDFTLYPREIIVSDSPNLIANGDFETGDTTGWETDIAGNSGVFTVTDAVSKCETYSGGFTANEAQLMTIRQANIGVGVVTPNSEITISFDLLGSAGDGGVFIAQVFSESTTAGVTKTDILNDGNPISLTDNWTRYSFTTTTGPDVTNGITLLLKTECGAVAGCAVNANIDNVYVAVGAGGGPDCDGGTTGGTPGGGDGDNGGGDTGGGTANGVELVENGDFETGVQAPWLFFDSATTNGGTTSLSSTESNGGGSFSARVQSGPGNNPGIKLERFAIGTVMANQSIEVKVDAKIGSLAAGAIVNVLAFSESATDGAPATLHNLGQINGAVGSWNTNTFSFTTAADVTGGISVLMEVVCGGVPDCSGDVFFDNISVQIVE